MLKELPLLITDEDNEALQSLPTMEEVKMDIMGLNRDSTGGPDNMTCVFYQETWDITGEDIYKMVRSSYGGAELPRYITHTNLVLLPKKVNVNAFSDLRPIHLVTL